MHDIYAKLALPILAQSMHHDAPAHNMHDMHANIALPLLAQSMHHDAPAHKMHDIYAKLALHLLAQNIMTPLHTKYLHTCQLSSLHGSQHAC